MAVFRVCLVFSLLAMWSASSDAASGCHPSCQTIKNEQRNAPTGTYLMQSRSGIQFQVYCEMGLNGGGYTYLHPSALTFLKNDEILSMFTDRTSFLLRIRQANGTQLYAVLNQLSEYAHIPLMLGLNNHTDYYPPINKKTIGEPYLYFGFLPIAVASNNALKGCKFNGKRVIFNCDFNPSGQLTLFPNYREVQPANSTYDPAACDKLSSYPVKSPSGRLMPLEFLMYGETQWGGCGCDSKAVGIGDVVMGNIGFR